jgi:hypothetical protein
MALHARYWVDAAVDLVLVKIISPVRQVSLNGVLEFIAWLQFILMSVAIGAKGFFVANCAGLALLLSVEPVTLHIIAGMVHRRPPVLVAIAAQGGCRYLNWVLYRPARRMGAGIDTEEHHEQR